MAKSKKPILSNGDMVRALLDDRKTQTRRPCKDQTAKAYQWVDNCATYLAGQIYTGWAKDNGFHFLLSTKCPYQPGDILWVRESMRVVGWLPKAQELELEYCVDGRIWEGVLPQRMKWKPKVGHCVPNGVFREAARIFLEVTGVRVERVQDITPANCLDEGILIPGDNEGKPLLRLTGKYKPSDYMPEGTMSKGKWPPEILDNDAFIKAHFASLWDSIYAKRGFGWDVNPWVWVIDFRRIENAKD